MKNLLERIPLTLKKFDSLLRRIDVLNQDALERLNNFVNDLYNTEYAELLRVWTLPHINDDMWHNYKLFDIHGLPEQLLLDSAITAFRDKLKAFSFKIGDRHEKRKKVAAKRAERSSDNS